MVPDALSGGPHFAAYCERYVRHTKGRWAGRPLVYEDWQREFWWEALEFDPATGLRIYNEVGLGIPRKNTKSTMASAAGLYMLDALRAPARAQAKVSAACPADLACAATLDILGDSEGAAAIAERRLRAGAP